MDIVIHRDVQEAKAQHLLSLHNQPELLVLPNAWDAGSAGIFHQLGFRAVATTSADIAFSRGYPDGEQIHREEMLAALRSMARCSRGPVTANLEGDYGTSDDATFATITGAIAAGVVGWNLEDGRPSGELISPAEMPRKLNVAREAAKSGSIPSFVINARFDVCLNGGT